MTEAAQLPADLHADLDAILRGSPLLAALGGELVEWRPGWATTRLATGPQHGNIAGSVHGGVIGTVADAAFEAACNSWGRAAVALSLATTFTAPAAIGTVLTATATEASRSRGAASYRVEVTDRDGRLVAWLLAVAHRTGRWHLGEQRWPADWRESY